MYKILLVIIVGKFFHLHCSRISCMYHSLEAFKQPSFPMLISSNYHLFHMIVKTMY